MHKEEEFILSYHNINGILLKEFAQALGNQII